MNEVYYTTYQRLDWLKLQALKGAEKTLAKKRNIFLDCGLKEAADRVMDDIAENMREQRRVTDKLIEDRHRMTVELVKVFLIAYMAYAKACDFEDLVKELTGSREEALSEDMRGMVKACETLALAIDKGAGDSRQVTVFGELADELEEWMRDKFEEELEEVISNSRNFDNSFS